MKKLCLLIPVLFSGLFVFAQQVLIPYKSGNKYGLCDQHRKLLVKPAYDEIVYLKGEYFQYTNTLYRKDSVRMYDGGWNVRERREYDCGVFLKDKLLLKNKNYRYFFILPRFIIGSDNEFRPEFCELYNLKGETVIEGTVRSVGVNDRRDFGDMVDATEKFTLLSVFKRAEGDVRLFSAAVYDNNKDKIVKWLLKDVREYKLIKSVTGPTYALCSYKDQAGFHESYIRFANNQYILQSKDSIKPGDLKQGNIDPDRFTKTVETGFMDGETAMVVEAPGNEEWGGCLYKLDKNGQLIVSMSGEKKTTDLPEGIKLIFTENGTNCQQKSLLVKRGNKFSLLSKGVLLQELYDTLVYAGTHFLAGKITGGKMQYGFIDNDGAVSVPLQYDSIPGPLFSLKNERVGDWKNLHDTVELSPGKGGYVQPNPSPYVRNWPRNLLVYKAGKAGMISVNNDIYLPVEYDMIAQNMFFFFRRNVQTGYFIAKKNGLYGVFQWDYLKQMGRFAAVPLTGMVFQQVPANYTDDYYGVKDFRLFALYNNRFEFVGYADQQGTRFFE